MPVRAPWVSLRIPEKVNKEQSPKQASNGVVFAVYHSVYLFAASMSDSCTHPPLLSQMVESILPLSLVPLVRLTLVPLKQIYILITPSPVLYLWQL